MRTFGYRRFLPGFVLLTIAALLLVQGLEHRVRYRQETGLTQRPAAALADPIIENYELPLPIGVITTLAAPGLLPFSFLGYSPMGSNLHTPFFLTIILAMTSLAWYAAGRWVDRRLGFIPRRPPMPGPLQQTLNWALLAAWVAAVSAVAAELIAIDFMEVMQWMAAGVICWGIFVSLILICRILEQRHHTRALAGATAPRVGMSSNL